MPSTGSWPVVRTAGCCFSVIEVVWFFRWARLPCASLGAFWIVDWVALPVSG